LVSLFCFEQFDVQVTDAEILLKDDIELPTDGTDGNHKQGHFMPDMQHRNPFFNIEIDVEDEEDGKKHENNQISHGQYFINSAPQDNGFTT
jgi:hypothetical protein